MGQYVIINIQHTQRTHARTHKETKTEGKRNMHSSESTLSKCKVESYELSSRAAAEDNK